MKNPIHRWVIVFVLLNMVLWQKGNDNPASRLAAMAAMTEYHSLRIDPYIETMSWTKDWARGPDGHLYSNKPPGPMLVGEPIFWGVDRQLMQNLPDDPHMRDARRRAQLPIYNWILSILFQVLPFALLAGLCLERLQAWGASEPAVHIAAAAMFFGNTAAVLMNLYFGHPMAAWCVLAAVLMLEKEFWGWMSFFIACAVLCDYGAVMLYPGLCFVAFWGHDQKLKRKVRIIAGAILPLLVGGIYHTICFGRPWRTALQFQAPEFVDLANQSHSFWGIFHMWPSVPALFQLLFGTTRGILFTQPWILLVIVGGVWILYTGKLPVHKRLVIFLLSGFFLLWIANATFGQWHGGWTIGPRYMCCIFPALGLLGGVLYDHVSHRWQITAWVLVGVSLLLCVLIFAGTPYVPQDFPLWPFLIRFVIQLPWPRTLLRAGLLAAGWYWAMSSPAPVALSQKPS